MFASDESLTRHTAASQPRNWHVKTTVSVRELQNFDYHLTLNYMVHC